MNLTDLTYLLPEVILLLTAALVLVLDAIQLKAGSSTEAPRTLHVWLPYIAIGGLLAAILGMIPSFGAAHLVASMIAVDPFALFFKVLAYIGIAIVILTAIPYLRNRTPHQGEFYAMLLIVGLAVSLAVSATNLVMVYLSMEFLSITSYILAGFLRQDRKSGEAALKYFLYGSTASAVMLYGMSLLYGLTGTTDLAGLAAALTSPAQDQLTWLGIPAIVLLLAGFGFKASLVPFHQWAPDTYEGAPTPVTAFLSTVSKAAGFAILIRVFLVAMGHPPLLREWTDLIIAISVITMSIGNLTALRQTNIKRLLAYSSIAQAGYMLIGVAAVLLEPAVRAGVQSAPTFTGINGVLIYLFAYLFTNVGAFAVVTAYETATGKTELRDYAGMVRRAPWLAALLFIFLISLAGIPPTGGFLGKFFVFGAAVQRQMWVLVAVAAVNSVVAAFYYLNVVRYMFFVPAEEAAESVAVALPLQGALLATGTITLLLGLAPGPLITWASNSVKLLALR